MKIPLPNDYRDALKSVMCLDIISRLCKTCSKSDLIKAIDDSMSFIDNLSISIEIDNALPSSAPCESGNSAIA